MSRLSYTCTVAGTEVDSSVDSSQRRSAAIDASDLMAVYDSARAAASAGPSAPVTCSRIVRQRPRQDEDLDWISRRMTPSCKNYGWDLKSVVSYDKWSCSYVGRGTVLDEDGKRQSVYNPFKRWSGTIASCASLGENADLSIPDSTMRAVKKLAYWQADGDNAELDVDQFICRIDSLPRL